MSDLTSVDNSTPVSITDSNTLTVKVRTSSPLSGDEALAIREVQRAQGTMATSIPVVIASDQSTLNVQTNSSFLEDSGHTTADIGQFTLAVRNDTNAALAGTDLDYIPFTTDATGGLRSSGNVAHDAADTGNPVKIGGQARTTNPTAVADADRVNFTADKLGRQILYPYQPRELTVRQRTVLTNTTETTVLTAGGAGVFHDVVSITLAFDDNAGLADGLMVHIRDSTAGTIVATLSVSNIGSGSGQLSSHLTFPVPLTQTTANNAWTAQCVTTPSPDSVYVLIVAVKNI